MKLRLAPLTEQSWFHYASFFEARSIPPPNVPKSAVLVETYDEGGSILLGGCCLFQMDGPWMFAEHFCMNPAASPTQTHEVLLFMLSVIRGTGSVLSKVPIVLVDSPGIKKVLERAGFEPLAVTAYFAHPSKDALPPGKEGNPKGEGGVTAPEPSKRKRARKKRAKKVDLEEEF